MTAWSWLPPMRTCLVVLLVLVVLVTPVAATTWTVEYFTRGAAGNVSTTWCDTGVYEFLWTPNYTAVYTNNTGIGTVFIGMYGAPALGYPAAVLPEGFPAIAFPASKDMASAVPSPCP